MSSRAHVARRPTGHRLRRRYRLAQKPRQVTHSTSKPTSRAVATSANAPGTRSAAKTARTRRLPASNCASASDASPEKTWITRPAASSAPRRLRRMARSGCDEDRCRRRARARAYSSGPARRLRCRRPRRSATDPLARRLRSLNKLAQRGWPRHFRSRGFKASACLPA